MNPSADGCVCATFCLECGGSTPPWNDAKRLRQRREATKAKAAPDRRTPRCFALGFLGDQPYVAKS